jgi:hypothetical protein
VLAPSQVDVRLGGEAEILGLGVVDGVEVHDFDALAGGKDHPASVIGGGVWLLVHVRSPDMAIIGSERTGLEAWRVILVTENAKSVPTLGRNTER